MEGRRGRAGDGGGGMVVRGKREEDRSIWIDRVVERVIARERDTQMNREIGTDR